MWLKRREGSNPSFGTTMKKQKLETLTDKDFQEGLLVSWIRPDAKYALKDLGEVVKKSDSGLLWYVWFAKSQSYGPCFPAELTKGRIDKRE